jgi:hypothetical protein
MKIFRNEIKDPNKAEGDNTSTEPDAEQPAPSAKKPKSS